MKRTTLQAIDHVNIEAPFGLEEELHWFYVEVGKLEPVDSDQTGTSQLCFKSGRLELRIRLSDRPCIEPIACRVTILVPSLSEVAGFLDEARVAYEHLSGLTYTDCRIGTNDPAGNRVELKQEWLYAPA